MTAGQTDNLRKKLETACFQVIYENPKTRERRMGTGFLISENKTGLTAHHVFPDEAEMHPTYLEVVYRGTSCGRILRNDPTRSYPKPPKDGDIAFVRIDADVAMNFIPLDPEQRNDDWWIDRSVAIYGFLPTGEVFVDDLRVQSVGPYYNQICKRVLKIPLRGRFANQPLETLEGLSGAPVYDVAQEQVIAIVHGYERVNGDIIACCLPVRDFDLLYERKGLLALRKAVVYFAAPIAFVTLIVVLWPYISWYLWLPSVTLNGTSNSVDPGKVGQIVLEGASSNLAETNRQAVLLLNPENEFARGWYLQQEYYGIRKVRADGTWKGRAQLGRTNYPVHAGDTYSVAIVVATPEKAAELMSEIRANREDAKVLVLPENTYGLKSFTWENLMFEPEEQE